MSASGIRPTWFIRRYTEELASASMSSKRLRRDVEDHELDEELSNNATSLPGGWNEDWSRDELSTTPTGDSNSKWGLGMGIFNLVSNLPKILTPPTSPDELSADIPPVVKSIAEREIYRPTKIRRTSPERSVPVRTEYDSPTRPGSFKAIPRIQPDSSFDGEATARRRKSPHRGVKEEEEDESFNFRSTSFTTNSTHRSPSPRRGPYPTPSLSPERSIKQESPAVGDKESAVDEIAGLVDKVNLLDEIAAPLDFERHYRWHRKADVTTPKSRSVSESKYTKPLQRRTRTVREAEAQREAEAKQLAAARAHIRQLRRYEPSEEDILLPLSDDWEHQVDVCLQTRNRAQKLAKTPDGSDLTINDFARVRPGQWLNDEIVNGYIRLIVDAHNARKGIKKGQTPKYHAFNTFFYTNLVNKGYQSVARWATRAKLGGKLLLEVDVIFIPINQSSHWTLLVISPPSRTIEYFDSFSGSPTYYVRAARTWLAGELGSLYREEEWTETKPGEHISPMQTNGWDCGVFAITTARMVAEKWEPLSYSESDINQQRRRVIAELLNGALLPWGEGDGLGRETESEHEEEDEDDEDELAY